MKLDLLEILNYKPDINWITDKNHIREKFKIDDKHCEIEIDEYEVLGKTLIDFGFPVNGIITATNGNKPETRILGAIYNAAKEKIKQLDYDLILVSVMKSSGLVESRKSLYSTLAKLIQRSLNLLFDSGWVENSNGFFRIWSKENLTKEELQIFINEVKSKEE